LAREGPRTSKQPAGRYPRRIDKNAPQGAKRWRLKNEPEIVGLWSPLPPVHRGVGFDDMGAHQAVVFGQNHHNDRGTAMKERSIIFSGPMVRAIMAGKKTQTRRVLKGGKCRYETGDRLWVRETHVYCEDDRHWYAADLPIQIGIVDGTPVILDVSDIKWTPSIYMPRDASRITLDVVSTRVERLQDISEDDAKAEGARALCTSCDGGIDPKFSLDEQHWPCFIDDNAKITYSHGFRVLWDNNAKRGFGWDTNPLVGVIEFKKHEVNA